MSTSLKYFCYLVLCIFVSSCVTPRTFQKNIYKYYKAYPLPAVERLPSWLSVHTDPKLTSSMTTSITQQSKYIPALFYWSWHKEIDTHLSRKIVLQRLHHYLVSQYSSDALSELLGDNTIAFSFETPPPGFKYYHKGFTAIFLISYMVQEQETLYPLDEAYVLRYTVKDKYGEIIKTGIVEAMGKLLPFSNPYQSTKNLTWNYLDDLHKSQDEVFPTLLNRVAQELKL